MKRVYRNESFGRSQGPAAVLAAAFFVFLLAGSALSGELIVNGTFESGSFGSSWVHGGGNLLGGINPGWADHAVVLDSPFEGNYSALLGFKYTDPKKNRYGFMYHDIAIPADISSARLFFRFRQQGYDGGDHDPFVITIRNTSGTELATVVNHSFSEQNNQFKDSGWIENDGSGPAGFDMTPWAGQTVRIHFRQENTYDNLFGTWTFVDNVSFVFTKYVDVIVDGNGDDLFGDPGTGLGGSSINSGEAGETVSYQLDVENESLDVDSYTLSVSSPAGWTAVISYGGSDYPFPWVTPSMPPGTSVSAEVRITIPPGETLGGYTTILDAVSTTSVLRFDSATLGTDVVASDHLVDLAIDSNGSGIIDPSGGGGISMVETSTGTTVEYSIDLENAGLLRDSFYIWFDAPAPLTAEVVEGALTHSGPFVVADIDPGDIASLTLRVIVPASLTGGDYNTVLYARSVSDPLRIDGVTAVTRVFAPGLDMIIAGNGDGIIDPTSSGLGGSSTMPGQRGDIVYFPIIVQNEGSMTDSFTLSWVRPTGGWSAVINDGTTDHPFPWTTPSIEPVSEAGYTLAVSIPANASYDTYASLLNASSETDPDIRESVMAGVSVELGHETDLMIDGDGADIYGAPGTGLGGSSLAAANPGDTVFFNVTVENEGGANTFDIEWNTPPGWEILFNGVLSPTTVAAGDYTLEVRIPLSSAGGTFDIIIDGMKSNKRYFADSVLGRVVVGYTYRVDALIDGNGDDLFGTPSLGDGGSAIRSTIGGSTVQYAVELQNQGVDPESYIVSWNSIIGWTALFDGSASPFTTLTVPGGGSGLYVFEVTAPLAAAAGDYSFIIDILSTVDSTNVESVTAIVHIDPPPLVDLLIDGSGAGVTGPAGSGGGGSALLFGGAGDVLTATLEVVNNGGVADSFMITWGDPAGWPAGSVLLSDGVIDHLSPFVTPVIVPGNSAVYTLTVTVPAGAALRNRIIIDGKAMSGDLEDSVLLEIGTSAFIAGFVFEDSDHDGAFDAGENGWGGVTVKLVDPAGDITAVTAADGSFIFEASAGIIRDLVEMTPSGMFSLSPDTVSTGSPAAGDTVRIDFADVRTSAIAPSLTGSGTAGGLIELPHTITAGTAGQASVAVNLPAGWLDVWYRDVNGDGMLDAGDTRLTTADLDLDPETPGQDMIDVILTVFVPAGTPVGMTASASVILYQTLSGTTIVTTAAVTDQLVVMASASGMLQLVKSVDLLQAHPGDVVTYTISFSNPGVEDVLEIEISDPVSPAVELLADAFGPGSDIEWVRGGVSVYLTADQADADEALYDPASGLLRVLLSRQAPFVLQSGETGQVRYRVRVR